jgi:hypothetical protein
MTIHLGVCCADSVGGDWISRDAQPLVVLGDELSRRGHQVVLGVSPNLVAFGKKAGLATFPMGPDSQQFLESPDGQRWLAAGDVMALTQALGKIVHDNAALLDADTLRVCEGADLIGPAQGSCEISAGLGRARSSTTCDPEGSEPGTASVARRWGSAFSAWQQPAVGYR